MRTMTVRLKIQTQPGRWVYVGPFTLDGAHLMAEDLIDSGMVTALQVERHGMTAWSWAVSA